MRIQWLLLAAGRSRRFGKEDKLGHHLHGKAIIQRTLEVFGKANIDVWVVTVGSNAFVKNLCHNMGVRCLIIEGGESGLGYTVKFGVARIATGFNIGIALADMPFISTTTLNSLNNPPLDSDTAIRCCMDSEGNIQPPAVFHSSLRGQLLSLPDHSGAQSIIKNHPRAVDYVYPPACELKDIDTPEDAIDCNETPA